MTAGLRGAENTAGASQAGRGGGRPGRVALASMCVVWTLERKLRFLDSRSSSLPSPPLSLSLFMSSPSLFLEGRHEYGVLFLPSVKIWRPFTDTWMAWLVMLRATLILAKLKVEIIIDALGSRQFFHTQAGTSIFVL